MNATNPHPRRPSRLAALGLVVLALLALAPTRARAEEDTHTIVPDRVLELMGLEAAYTRVFGLHLPGRPGDLLDGLEPGEARERALQVLDDNRAELDRFGELDHKASGVAVAFRFGGAEGALWNRPFGLDWLRLEDVSLVVAAVKASNTMDVGTTVSVRSVLDRHAEGADTTSSKTWRTRDGGSLQVGIAATAYVGTARFTVALTLARDTDLKASLKRKVASRVKRRKTAYVGPETNTTVSHAGNPDQDDDEITSREDAGRDTYVPGMEPGDGSATEDGVVPEGTKAQRAPQDEDKAAIHLMAALMADELDLRGVRGLVEALGVDTPLDELRTNAPFGLREVIVAIDLDLRRLASLQNPIDSVSVLGSVQLPAVDVEAYGLVSVRRVDGRWKPFVAARLSDFSFQDVAPGLEGTLVGDVHLPSVALTWSFDRDILEIRSTDLNPAEAAFYDEVCVPWGPQREKAYTLSLRQGMNLTGPLPISIIPQAVLHGFGMLDEATGGGEPYVILEGNPGIDLGLGFGGVPSLSDMVLRATLPPISPKRAPKWLVKGELYLEVTGRPSLAIGGALTLDIQGDEVEFFLEGALARDGAGVSVSLTGGMTSTEGWKEPFGIEWLTLNEVIAKISFNANGNVGLGFRADMVVGRKTIDVAIFVAINAYSGVPSNFIFEGATNAIALEDLARLQEAMAAAAGRPARLPVAALPNVELRDLYLRFAPKDDPDLGVEAGFGIAGALWVESRPDAMERVAEVDVLLSKDGIELYGFVKGYSLGPITWDDAEVDMALTPERQGFSIHGLATVVAKQRRLAVNLTPRGMLEDFVAAHGAAISGALDGAKEALGDAADAAKEKVATLKGIKRRFSVRRR